MNILKHKYIGGAMALLLAVTSCSTDTLPDLTRSDTPIQLQGVTTRTGGGTDQGPLAGYTGLKLTAKYESNYYFENKDITVGEAITTDGVARNKLESPAFYPLGDTKINLFAHTGNITNGNLSLTAGKAQSNDILISNGTDGTGTPAASNDVLTILDFRHVMTKLEVSIDVDDTTGSEVQPTLPTDITFKFDNSSVPSTGTYGLAISTTNDAANKAAVSGTTAYTLNVGTHYLVPTGADLTGENIIKYLKIDDYTATTEDLKTITVPQVTATDGTKSNLILKPGLAYKLTFKIERLRVVGITLTLDDWNKITDALPEWGYDPYKMTLSFTPNGYDASLENNKITQVVLHHKVTENGIEKDYQYVGKGSYTDNSDKKTDIDFLSIPKSLSASSKLTIDVYTPHGLLILEQEVAYTSTAGKSDIQLNLSANGMVSDGTNTYLISTPLQFHNLLTNPQDNRKYRIIKNIDMNALVGTGLETTALKDFPTGSTLEGGMYTENIIDNEGNTIAIPHACSILHLNSSKGSGLFATNYGTIKNVYIFSGTITGSDAYTGSICGINNGAIEGCVNEADIATSGTTAGGICGKNNGTLLACLNTGNIKGGTTIGGICGENTKTDNDVIKACINTGMLNKDAQHLGGICGSATTTVNKIMNTCYWLTGTARKNQDISNEVAIGSDPDNTTHCTNASDLSPVRLRSIEIIGLLNTAASTWKFKMEPTICAWPIPETTGSNP